MENSKKKTILMLGWLLAVPAFALSQISFWGFSALAASTSSSSPATPVDQAAVDKTQGSISDLQDKLEKEQEKKAKLEQNLSQIQQSVSSTQYEISKAQSAIKTVQSDIDRKESEIANLGDKMQLQKEMLKGFLQQAYYIQNQPILNVVLSNGSFSDIFGDADRLLTLEDKIRNVSADIAEAKTQVEQDKVQLAQTKEKHENLLNQKVDQKQGLLADQADVASDVAEKEATIADLQGKLNKLRGDLSSLLGEDLSTDDIVEAARIAGKATGVRKDFILGELVVETDLGRFTGGCTYKNIRMKPEDKSQFLKIAAELSKAYGGDYTKKKLSCSPGYGYGGAMGVAQFMPTTWIGYKSYIASATGHNPPDPWNVIDGVMGMAKKLANGGANSKSGEVMASKRYYCGGPSSPYWNTKCATYAKNVQYWADNYEKKL